MSEVLAAGHGTHVISIGRVPYPTRRGKLGACSLRVARHRRLARLLGALLPLAANNKAVAGTIAFGMLSPARSWRRARPPAVRLADRPQRTHLEAARRVRLIRLAYQSARCWPFETRLLSSADPDGSASAPNSVNKFAHMPPAAVTREI